MTSNFDSFVDTIMENIDILTVSRMIDKYHNRIRKFNIRNYDTEPQHIDKMRNLQKQAIDEYNEFVELNHDDIVKSGLQHKILQFKKELRRNSEAF